MVGWWGGGYLAEELMELTAQGGRASCFHKEETGRAKACPEAPEPRPALAVPPFSNHSTCRGLSLPDAFAPDPSASPGPVTSVTDPVSFLTPKTMQLYW